MNSNVCHQSRPQEVPRAAFFRYPLVLYDYRNCFWGGWTLKTRMTTEAA